MDSARHVIGCHLTQETRVHKALDDVASTIHSPYSLVGERRAGERTEEMIAAEEEEEEQAMRVPTPAPGTAAPVVGTHG